MASPHRNKGARPTDNSCERCPSEKNIQILQNTEAYTFLQGNPTQYYIWKNI